MTDGFPKRLHRRGVSSMVGAIAFMAVAIALPRKTSPSAEQFTVTTTVTAEATSCNGSQVESAGVIEVDSVCLEKPYTPAGPTIAVTLTNNGTVPIVGLEAILSISGANQTYPFIGISEAIPMQPGSSATDMATFIGGGFDSSQRYPLEISAWLENGPTEYYTVYVAIGTA